MKTVWIGCVVGICACDLQEAVQRVECEVDRTNLTVGGEWSLTGDGTRTGCADPIYDGPFELASDAPLAIEQFSTRERADQIDYTENTTSSLFLSGSVEGSCVVFDVREAYDDKPVRYAFDGVAVSSDRIRGTFTGVGPGECRSSGTFLVDVAPFGEDS